jgi:hypothetical protein
MRTGTDPPLTKRRDDAPLSHLDQEDPASSCCVVALLHNLRVALLHNLPFGFAANPTLADVWRLHRTNLMLCYT